MRRLARGTRREFLVTGVASVIAGTEVAAEAKPGRATAHITPAQIEGPFYRPDAPFRSNLRGDDPDGEVLIVEGLVLGHPGRRPLSGAVVDVWQANHLGHYDNETGDFDATRFALRGRVKTDNHGRYRFETTMPANYALGPDTPQLRPKHIHFKVFAPGHVPLTTQMYFEDDPYLDLDPFAVTGLAVKTRKHNSAELLREQGVDRPFSTCTFDIALAHLSKAAYGAEQSGRRR